MPQVDYCKTPLECMLREFFIVIVNICIIQLYIPLSYLYKPSSFYNFVWYHIPELVTISVYFIKGVWAIHLSRQATQGINGCRCTSHSFVLKTLWYRDWYCIYLQYWGNSSDVVTWGFYWHYKEVVTWWRQFYCWYDTGFKLFSTITTYQTLSLSLIDEKLHHQYYPTTYRK